MSTQDHIIKKSYEAFYRHGFNASGVNFLAEQAGVTKRTLYAHFANKQALIKAVLEYRHEEFMTQLSSAFAHFSEYNLENVVTCYMNFLQTWTQSTSFYGCLFINVCAEFADSQDSCNQLACQHKVDVREFLEKCLEKCSSVKYSKDSRKQMADYLFIFGEGVIVSAQLHQDAINVDPKHILAMLRSLES